jgi:hypothetical protein
VVRLNALNLTGHCFCCDKLCQLTTRHVARQCLVVLRYIDNYRAESKISWQQEISPQRRPKEPKAQHRTAGVIGRHWTRQKPRISQASAGVTLQSLTQGTSFQGISRHIRCFALCFIIGPLFTLQYAVDFASCPIDVIYIRCPQKQQ